MVCHIFYFIGNQNQFKYFFNEETKLVNEDWLKEKKNNNSLVLKLFKKENDYKFSSVDGTISINIKNENGKEIICNANDVENFLYLNKKKLALFEIKNNVSNNDIVKKLIDNKGIKKFIIVKDKIISIVI